MAPEVRMAPRGHYSKRADVYSFGESSEIRWNGILELLLFGSEILESCHSSRLSWISKIHYQIESHIWIKCCIVIGWRSERYLAWNYELETRLSDIVSHLRNNWPWLCTADLASYLLSQWQFWQLTLKWLSGARALSIKPNNIIAVFFFSYFIHLSNSRKIHFLTREFRVRLHLKIGIALIASRFVRYQFSRAI